MRRYISIFTMVVFLVFSVFLCSCSSDNEPITMKDKEVKKTLIKEYDALNKKFDKKPSFSEICRYLESYTGKYDLKLTHKEKEYAVFSISPHESYEDAESITIQMPVNYFNTQEQNQVLSVLITFIRSTGAHGRTDILLTDAESESFSGAKAADRKYIDKDNFINLAYTSNTSLFNRGASSVHSIIKEKYRKKDSSYKAAYRISITGLKGGSLNEVNSSSDNPSPVKELANLLVSMKSSGYPFELISFEGGEGVGEFAKDASVVVAVPGSEKKKLISRYENRKESFDEKYGEREPNYSYSLISTDSPKKAVSRSDADDIINMLYTLDSEITKTSDKEVSSVINLGKVNISDNEFRLDIGVRDTDRDSLKETLNGFSTSCGLFNAECTNRDYCNPWITSEKTPLAAELSELIETEPQSTVMVTENTIFKDRIPTLCTVTLGVNVTDGLNAIKALTDYLSGLNEEKDG